MERLNLDKFNFARKLFKGYEEATCQCVLDGQGGTIFVDSNEEPSYAICTYADLAFFAGKPVHEEVDKIIKELLQFTNNSNLIFVPYKDDWLKAFESSKIVRKFSRYSIERRKMPFDKKILNGYISTLPQMYKLSPINRELAEQVLKEEWCRDFCSAFITI